MSGFLAGALLVSLIAVALVVWPLLRRGAGADFSRLQLNTAIYRDQFAELERDRDAGTLSQADFEQARAELQRRMLEDAAGEPVPGKQAGKAPAAAEPPGRALPIALGGFLLVGAAVGYMALGAPQAINAPSQAGHAGDEAIERMVAEMAAKLEKEPANFKGWAMLARSYKVMNRYPEAVRAYARTGPMLDTSAELLVDYADALAAAERGFTKDVLVLIDKALKLDPTNLQGLWLRGTAAYEAARYDKAIADWELLHKGLPPDSEESRVVAANIAEARELLGKPGKKVGAGGTAAAAPSAKASITGRVELAPAVKDKARPDDVVFVFARAVDGPRMPLAVLRLRAADLPADFTLDDRNALSPQATLASAAQLRVEVRVSKSGQATPGPGDLVGASRVVKPGATGVKVLVDRAEP